jgi:hypothetical protein
MEEITVSTRDEAETLRFPGSPTVRVHGRDLQPKAEEAADYGLG